MSRCEEIREALWPLDRPRDVTAEEAAARAHLEACPACRAFFARDAAVSRALSSRGLAVSASPELRRRLRDLLADPPAGSTSRRGGRRRVGRALGRTLPWAVAAAFAGLAFGLATADRDMEGIYAQDFMARSVETTMVPRPDIEAVSAYFMRELGVPVVPVALDASPMRRAMVCVIDGKRAALVEYEIDGYAVAHYRVPITDSRPRRPRTPAAAEENGVCVYRWSDTKFEHALVSDMPESRLVALAEASFHATP